MQSILPVSDIYKKFGSHTNKHKNINKLNTTLKQHATTNHYTYIDLYTSFCNENGKLIKEFTNDSLHLKGDGYLLWKHLFYPYVYNLELKPSLSPKTQLLKWNMVFLQLYLATTILANNPTLAKDALVLKNAMEQKGLNVKFSKQTIECSKLHSASFRKCYCSTKSI